jgi:hypothetical protein
MYWLFNENTCQFDVADESALGDVENIVVSTKGLDCEIVRNGKTTYWRDDEQLDVFGNIFYREDFEQMQMLVGSVRHDHSSALSIKSK